MKGFDRLVFIGDEILHTNKAKCLYKMNSGGLNIPYTVIVTDIERIGEMKKHFEFASSVFCRINFSDTTYPHYESKICLVEDIENEISIIINKLSVHNVNCYDIIIQEMLNLSWSGAILYKNEISLIELVYGNTTHLLRDGIFYERFFIDKKRVILKQEKGEQTQFRELADNQLILKEMPSLSFNIELLLENISYLSEDNTLYEFGLNYNQFFFLESKEVYKESYPSLSLQKIDKIPFIIWQDDKFYTNRSETIELPIFDNIACIDTGKTYKISKGAYLSHFSIFLANNKTNSYFDCDSID